MNARGLMRVMVLAWLLLGLAVMMGRGGNMLPWLPWPAWARNIAAGAAMYGTGMLAVWLFDRYQLAAGTFDPFLRVGGRPGWFSEWREQRLARRELRKFGRIATAGWEEGRAIVRRGLREGDIFLGRACGTVLPVGLETEKHFVTLGSSGAGKSAASLIPNLCFHEGSLLCIDPKGELAPITAARRGQGGNGVKGMGQDVHVLDPFGITGLPASRYNVFDEMAAVAAKNPDRPVSYAGKIADALIRKTPDAKDPFWEGSAHDLVRGIVLYIFSGEGERNLARLRRLLMEGDRPMWEAQPADVREKVNASEMLFEAMRLAPPGPYRETIAGAGVSMLEMDDKVRSGVLATAREQTSFLDAPELQRATAGSDFLLDDFKRKKMSVYLCLPLDMIAGKEARWLSIVVRTFIDTMLSEPKKLEPPVLLAMDEFPSLGKLEKVEFVAPTMRSAGVRFWALAQDISQLKETYPAAWSGFLGNAEAVQFMGVTHAETVDFISERLGKHVVVSEKGGHPVAQERPLLEAEQVGRLLWPKLKNQIVWRGTRKPMLLKATPYYEYLPAWYYSPDSRYPETWKRRRFRTAKNSHVAAASPPLPAERASDASAASWFEEVDRNAATPTNPPADDNSAR